MQKVLFRTDNTSVIPVQLMLYLISCLDSCVHVNTVTLNKLIIWLAVRHKGDATICA